MEISYFGESVAGTVKNQNQPSPRAFAISQYPEPTKPAKLSTLN